VTAIERSCAWIEYAISPKLVGARATTIRFPAASQPLGVECASSSPLAVSCTSSSRNVSRKVAFEALLGGRYIARYGSLPIGVTEAASPATYVPGVIAAASWP
jgi:hypothetical protein